jgi:hypothetical protein
MDAADINAALQPIEASFTIDASVSRDDIKEVPAEGAHDIVNLDEFSSESGVVLTYPRTFSSLVPKMGDFKVVDYVSRSTMKGDIYFLGMQNLPSMKSLSRVGFYNYVEGVIDYLTKVEIVRAPEKMWDPIYNRFPHPAVPLGFDLLNEVLDSKYNNATHVVLHNTLFQAHQSYYSGDDYPGVREVTSFMRQQSAAMANAWRDQYSLFILKNFREFASYLALQMSSSSLLVVPKELDLPDEYYTIFIEGGAANFNEFFDMRPILMRHVSIFSQLAKSKLIVSSGNVSQTRFEALQRLNINVTSYSADSRIPGIIARVDVPEIVKKLAITSLLPIQLTWNYAEIPEYDPITVAGSLIAIVFFSSHCFTKTTYNEMVTMVEDFLFRNNPGDFHDEIDNWRADNGIAQPEYGLHDIEFDAFDPLQLEFQADEPFNPTGQMFIDGVNILFGRVNSHAHVYVDYINGQLIGAIDANDHATATYSLFTRLLARIQRPNAGRGNYNRRHSAAINLLEWSLTGFPSFHVGMVDLGYQIEGLAMSPFMNLGYYWEAHGRRNAYGPDPNNAIYRGRAPWDAMTFVSEIFEPAEIFAAFIRFKSREVIVPSVDIGYILQGLEMSKSLCNIAGRMTVIDSMRDLYKSAITRRDLLDKHAVGKSEYFDKVIAPSLGDIRDEIYNSFINIHNWDSCTVQNRILATYQPIIRATIDHYLAADQLTGAFRFISPPYLFLYHKPALRFVNIVRGDDFLLMPGIQQADLPNVPIFSYQTFENIIIQMGYERLMRTTFVLGPVPYTFSEVDVEELNMIYESDVIDYGDNDYLVKVNHVQLNFSTINKFTKPLISKIRRRRIGEFHPVITQSFSDFYFPSRAAVLQPRVVYTLKGDVKLPEFSDLMTVRKRL